MPTYSPDDRLRLTNLSKVYWPECGLTKGDLIAYYREVAPVIVPHLADRPQVLHRHVDGHGGKEFFQRVSRHAPKWMPTVRIPLEGREREYHICNDWPALLWMANFGCNEFIPWNSRIDALDRPDHLSIDLDPESVPLPRLSLRSPSRSAGSSTRPRRPASSRPRGSAACMCASPSAGSTSTAR